MKTIIFTDLDGTLLDDASKSHTPAVPAIRLVEERGIPLIFCSSKTRAEIEYYREKIGNRHPFIVENGGAIFIPEGYFDKKVDSKRRPQNLARHAIRRLKQTKPRVPFLLI